MSELMDINEINGIANATTTMCSNGVPRPPPPLSTIKNNNNGVTKQLTSPMNAISNAQDANMQSAVVVVVDDGGSGMASPSNVDATAINTSPSPLPTTSSTAIATPSPLCNIKRPSSTPNAFITHCSNPDGCVTLADILKCFNAAVSEEQAWALIYQSVRLYRDALHIGMNGHDDGNGNGNKQTTFDSRLRLPNAPRYFNVHKDGSVHVSFQRQDGGAKYISSEHKILYKLGVMVYQALDYNLPDDEECNVSSDLESVIQKMTLAVSDANDDEGIEQDSEYSEDQKCMETKELDDILELCAPRVLPFAPEDHYKAVCRALVTETLELRVFLQKIYRGDTDNLRVKADIETTKHELQTLAFSDWARFWMQVVDELRRGVRLKKCSYERPSLEFELTPYEILMDDIRSRKYKLRKVMVNGDVPPRIKRDAHAMILEFIRSRPPLKKASDRKLSARIFTPTPREELLDSIRKGRVLKHIQPNLKTRLLPSMQPTITKICKDEQPNEKNHKHINGSPKPRQRLIHVDKSIFNEEDLYSFSNTKNGHSMQNNSGFCRNHISGFATVCRKTHENGRTYRQCSTPCENRLESYDLATHYEPTNRCNRHCQLLNSRLVPQSSPVTRSHSRQSNRSSASTGSVHSLNNLERSATTTTASLSSSVDAVDVTDGPKHTDHTLWQETVNESDRLALSLEEIVHIRSVITKAELESLDVGVQIKESVEKRKICFLCLRTRFTFFVWGVQCKLCDRTVCSKCCSKMRIQSNHFRNVPALLLSPPCSSAPVSISPKQSPSPTALSGPSSVMDDSFPRSLIERLLRSDSVNKSNPHDLPDTRLRTNPDSKSQMSRNSDGPNSLPPQQFSVNNRSYANNRRSRLARALSGSTENELNAESQKGEMMSVCNDCRNLIFQIMQSSEPTQANGREKALCNLTLNLSPIYKRW